MPTEPKPSTLHGRIQLAWRTAIELGLIDTLEDFAAAIEVEADDGQQLLANAPVAQWLEGSVVPSFRTIMAMAKVARYDRRATKRLLYGAKASKFNLTERDWQRFIKPLDSARSPSVVSSSKGKPRRAKN